MSYIGKNIKKIRGIKSLSQQAFAELFDLKRATLGAYEEQRSEPKVETIIQIANYFSIPIDDLLTKELTVNQLLKFKGELTVDTEEMPAEIFASIPCITEKNEAEYILYSDKSRFIEDMPCLRLPLNPERNFRGYTVSNLEMTSHDQGLFPRDVVIGEWMPAAARKKLNNGELVLVLAQNQLILRRWFMTSKEVVMRADHKSIEDIRLPIGEIKELWRIKYVFYRRIPSITDNMELRLKKLEEKLSGLDVG